MLKVLAADNGFAGNTLLSLFFFLETCCPTIHRSLQLWPLKNGKCLPFVHVQISGDVNPFTIPSAVFMCELKGNVSCEQDSVTSLNEKSSLTPCMIPFSSRADENSHMCK